MGSSGFPNPDLAPSQVMSFFLPRSFHPLPPHIGRLAESSCESQKLQRVCNEQTNTDSEQAARGQAGASALGSLLLRAVQAVQAAGQNSRNAGE